MLGHVRNKIFIVPLLITTLLLAGCGSYSGANNGGTNGGGGTTNPSQPPLNPGGNNGTPTPTPTPTPTETVPPDEHGHGEQDPVAAKAEGDFARSFAGILSNKSMSTEAWRAAVVPYLYSDQLKALYGTLDPYSIPFCGKVKTVEVGVNNTFSVVYKVTFENSSSYLAMELKDVSTDLNSYNYQVTYIDSQMVDNGGC